ncbi:hypothetical protein GE061_018825 [Apolygus lucorum]|uniref:Uncharacterized protein n=1 Tax=Apolygus lucorum TaxID=248454 RepID=A0A8S9XAT7_APOLU|nr:hypothetical protein GE061_018825 [Apolygus lucorum]
MNRAEMSFKLPAAKMKVLLLLFSLIALTFATDEDYGKEINICDVPKDSKFPHCDDPNILQCNFFTGKWECSIPNYLNSI